jgi:hypothetical protein
MTNLLSSVTSPLPGEIPVRTDGYFDSFFELTRLDLCDHNRFVILAICH